MAKVVPIVKSESGLNGIVQLVDLVHEVVALSMHWLQPLLKGEGITMGEFMAMHHVLNIDNASVSTVARHLGVSAPTVCVNIDRLVDAGLVHRHRSERDRRAVELSLTPKGRKVEARIWIQLANFMSEGTRSLPEADITAAIRVFREAKQRFLSGGSSPGEAP
jgi:DNA-binding MarR family transcriptional regulator